MTIRQWTRRTWWRAKRALVRGLDRQLGTDMIPRADVMKLEAGRAITIHLLNAHEYQSTVGLVPGDSLDLTLEAATASGFRVPEPLTVIIDSFSSLYANDPYADRRR